MELVERPERSGGRERALLAWDITISATRPIIRAYPRFEQK